MDWRIGYTEYKHLRCVHVVLDYKNCLVQSKWNLRKTVLLLAEDPATGSFRDSSLPATVGPNQG